MFVMVISQVSSYECLFAAATRKIRAYVYESSLVTQSYVLLLKHLHSKIRRVGAPDFDQIETCLECIYQFHNSFSGLISILNLSCSLESINLQNNIGSKDKPG